MNSYKRVSVFCHQSSSQLLFFSHSLSCFFLAFSLLCSSFFLFFLLFTSLSSPKPTQEKFYCENKTFSWKKIYISTKKRKNPLCRNSKSWHSYCFLCRCGETGRRGRLKIYSWQQGNGSSPFIGISMNLLSEVNYPPLKERVCS